MARVRRSRLQALEARLRAGTETRIEDIILALAAEERALSPEERAAAAKRLSHVTANVPPELAGEVLALERGEEP
jgi:hypothetical protein